MNEVVSVIVPIYNVQKYLKKCIESIIGQSYKNLEIILVNDGSTDDSPVICEEYKVKDSRITVIHKRNGGLSDARNAGLDICKGKYVFFVDSDDYIHPETIYEMLLQATQNNAEIVECGIYHTVENDDTTFAYARCEKIVKVYNHDDAVRNILDYHFSIVAWNKLYISSLFNNIRFPVGKLHEDEFIIPFIVDKCQRYITISNQYYAYVQRTGSIMNQQYDKRRLDVIEAHEARLKYFNEKYKNKYNYIMAYHYFVACMELKQIMKENYCDSNIQKLAKKLAKQIIFGNGNIGIKIKAIFHYFLAKISN